MPHNHNLTPIDESVDVDVTLMHLISGVDVDLNRAAYISVHRGPRHETPCPHTACSLYETLYICLAPASSQPVRQRLFLQHFHMQAYRPSYRY